MDFAPVIRNFQKHARGRKEGGDTRGWSTNRGAKSYVKKADGGRIGYAEGDVAATELGMLNNWWKNMQANDWKE